MVKAILFVRIALITYDFRAIVWIFRKLKKLNVGTLESVKPFVCGISIVVTMVLILLESAVIIPVVESEFQAIIHPLLKHILERGE